MDPRDAAFYKNYCKINEASMMIDYLKNENEKSMKYMKVLRDIHIQKD